MNPSHVNPGHVYSCRFGEVACAPFQACGSIIREVDLAYVDPPWSAGILTMFQNAARKGGASFPVETVESLHRKLVDLLDIHAGAAFIECGQNQPMVERLVPEPFESYGLTYYGGRRCGLVQFRMAGRLAVLEGADDHDAPGIIMDALKPETVLDLCAGLGATSRAALKRHVYFIGCELVPARLARLVDYWIKHGAQISERPL